MNDEIKEILEEIDDKIIPNEHWNKIKDYIINLQEENERLRLELSGYREAILRDDKLLGLKDYKSRCEKAIEWIKEHIATYQKNDIAILDWDTFADPRNLLKILGGDK